MDILLDTGFLVALIVKPQNLQQTEQHETAKQMLKTHENKGVSVNVSKLSATN